MMRSVGRRMLVAETPEVIERWWTVRCADSAVAVYRALAWPT